jgi:aminopeptidase N
VLGNMPVKSQRSEPEGLVTSFETTPRMSTYLVAWVVGTMQSKSTKTNRGVEVNVWATPAQPADSLDFAATMAARVIDFYEDYFGVNYPLPKSDHVALPDFAAGAMENWGLITYREMALLADPKTTSIASRQYIATVIAHELAHQWFGNLVTMKWWNDLWLNESFANMMEYLAIDRLEPSWNMWLEFSSREVVMALRRDSIDGVQSVQIDVNHPDEIQSIFDGAIVYAKGGRLLRMLQQYIGDDAFRAGLKAYFTQFAYNNTAGNDLWQAMDKASSKDITSLMNTWISQPGFPVVHAITKDKNVELTQEQFFIGPHSPSNRLWPIPLDGSTDTLEFMAEKTIATKFDQNFLLNCHDSTHFLSHYDELSLQAILARVQNGSLDELNRLQLLNQSTLLARGGVMPSVQLIDLVRVFENETSEPVWALLSMTLAELRKFVDEDPEAEKALRSLTGKIAQKQYERLGWDQKDDESEDDTKLRSTIISMMLYGENAGAIDHAKTLFHDKSLDSLDPELRALILSSVVRDGDQRAIDDLLMAYPKTSSPDIQLDICLGLTSVRQPDQIERLLDVLKDSKIIRPQDVGHWFVYLLRNRDGRTQSWAWLQENWQWIHETFKGDQSYADYARYTGNTLSKSDQLEAYKQFFTPMRDDPAMARIIDMGLIDIEGRVGLIDKDGAAVRQKLVELQ